MREPFCIATMLATAGLHTCIGIAAAFLFGGVGWFLSFTPPWEWSEDLVSIFWLTVRICSLVGFIHGMAWYLFIAQIAPAISFSAAWKEGEDE